MVFESLNERVGELETEVSALYLAFRDSRTPLAAKAVITMVVAYAVSPIDPIPDFLPGVGFLDELVVLPPGIAVALWLVPDDVIDECRERAGDEVDAGRIRWVGAAIVLLIWTLVGLLVVRTAPSPI